MDILRNIAIGASGFFFGGCISTISIATLAIFSRRPPKRGKGFGFATRIKDSKRRKKLFSGRLSDGQERGKGEFDEEI